MPFIQLRGRVINKITRQPISRVTLKLLKKSGGSVLGGTTPITVDADGEFDHTSRFRACKTSSS